MSVVVDRIREIINVLLFGNIKNELLAELFMNGNEIEGNRYQYKANEKWYLNDKYKQIKI